MPAGCLIMNNEADLVTKSYRSILIAWVAAVSWCIALHEPWIGLSLTLGTVLGTAMLAALDYTVRRILVPGAVNPRKAFWKLALLKFPVIGFALYWLVRWERINLIAFCGGIVLVHFAMLCKGIGISMMDRAHKSAASPKES